MEIQEQTQSERQCALFFDHGRAALVARDFVFAGKNKKLAGAGLEPVGFPVGVILVAVRFVAVRFQGKLCQKQLPGTKTEAYSPPILIVLDPLQALEQSQPSNLLLCFADANFRLGDSVGADVPRSS